MPVLMLLALAAGMDVKPHHKHSVWHVSPGAQTHTVANDLTMLATMPPTRSIFANPQT